MLDTEKKATFSRLPDLVSNADGQPRPVSIDALTGLRFVAALLVFFHHLPRQVFMIFPQFVREFAYAGYCGVSLFFVLSGFVLTYNYYEVLKQPSLSRLWSYFGARIARIYPVYLLFMALALLSIKLTDELSLHPNVALQHLLLVHAWNPDVSVPYSYNSAGWSVSVEVFLYLCFPVLTYFVFRFCRQRWQLLLLGLVALSTSLGVTLWFSWQPLSQDFAWTAHYWLYRSPLLHLTDFELGCVAARLYMLNSVRSLSRREKLWGRLALAGAVAGTLTVMVLNEPALFMFRYGPGYLLFFVVIIYCLARYQEFGVGRFLATKFMLLLGEASYSFYLFHYFFIVLLFPASNNIPSLRLTLFAGVVLVVIVLQATGIYKYFESSARRAVRRVLRA